MAVIVSCVFGAISGAAASSVIAIGTIMIPQMEKHGYPRGYSAALISSAAVLSTMIPPSLAMIMYAFVTGQSVAACFLATMGPALMLAVLFCIINVFIVRKMPSIEVPPQRPFKEHVTLLKQKSQAAVGAILMPVMILGGIYGGIMTPTEAAASAVVYSIILGCFVYREMKLGKTLFLLRSSAVATGTMVLMTFFAAILGTNLGMGMMTPPMAGILYIGARTGNVTIDKMMRPALMLILFGSIPTILLTTFWEPLSIYLPTLAGFIH
ncbi:MAG: TRAP transporter large permease subunit [Desulfobulbaceae bacterium]|nr:TRAP transporter large permease subunit [Desulfobulbaceae bacterium]